MKPYITFLQSTIIAKHRSFLIAGMFCLMAALPVTGQSPINIYRLMDTTGLTLTEIEVLADQYFQVYGTGKGSGHKHYQRWLYERKFNVDDAGYLIPKSIQNRAFQSFVEAHPKTRSTVGPWNELGPDYWSATSGWNPGNGRLKSIAINPSNPATIYAASPGGGIWKTTNGGGSWNPLVDFENSEWMDAFALAIDPSSTSKVYAGLNYGGVLKSTDGGSSWDETGSGPEGIKKIVVHPTNTNIVLVASNEGIHRSTNGGNSWTLVSSVGMEDIKFKPGDPNTVYASGGVNVFMRSTNNGVAWTNIGAAGGITHTGRTLIGTSTNNPNVVYAVQSDDLVKGFGRLYKSINSGLTFTTTIIGNPVNGTNFFCGLADGTEVGGQAWHDMAICVNPANANEVYIAGINCWKSTNGGTSFSIISHWAYTNNTIGYNHADIHHLEFVNGTLYSASDGGIYKSTNNGDDWQDLSEGLAIRQIYRLSCSELNSNVICIGSQDNGTSARTTNGNWIDWLGADGMDNAISHSTTQVMYGVEQYGFVDKTIDGGQTRVYLPNQPSTGNWVTPISIDPNNHNNLYVGWEGVYKTTNGGSTWSNISAGSITQKLDNLVVAPSNVNFIYASIGSQLYRTSNGGSSWTSINVGEPITSICVSKTNPNKIWITLNDQSAQVKVSENMGTTLTDVSAGLPQLTARCIVVDEDENNGIYVGLNIGVYYRNDNMSDWELYGSDLPLVAINDIEMVKSANLIRIATYGRGVWETNLETVGSQICPESCCIPFVTSFNDCHDFENFNLGNLVPQGSPSFTLFSSQSQNATVVSTPTSAGIRAIKFVGTADIYYNINRSINTVTRLEWMTYIPAGKAGAFGFYTLNSQIYPINVEYNNGVAKIYNQTSTSNNPQVGSFSYQENSWFKSVIIFFPDDRIEYWQNGTLQYTLSNYTSNQIGKLNFYYGEVGATEFYIDDICYGEKLIDYPCTLELNPVCVNGAEYANPCLAGQIGYSSCEWTEGSCQADPCDGCSDCFTYIPIYQVARTIQFQNEYCGGGIVMFQDQDHQRALTYQWTVMNATVQYTNGTSSASENPICRFPSDGTYTVCQTVYSFGESVFECCRTVIIGGCSGPPVAYYSSTFQPFNNVFVLTSNAGSNAVQWSFSDPEVEFWAGDTEFTPSPTIIVPSGKCVIACLWVTNACGSSSYCTELCLDNSNCSGTTPLVLVTNAIQPEIEDLLVSIDLPITPGGAQTTYAWDFGDGSVASSKNVSHTYDEYGNYNICVTITIGCRTWCYCWCINLNPCQPVYTQNDGSLVLDFIGSETDLRYTFTSTVQKAAGESWLVNGNPVAGGSLSLTYSFPTAGNYEICFPYLAGNGCIYYKCIDVGAGNPFTCNNITWQFSNTTGYRFSLPAGSSQITWTVDETNQEIGQSATSNWVPPVNPCTWRTISVRYFDGVRFRICCLRIYLCAPDECYGSIDYGYLSSSDKATFKLNATGSTDISWYFDDAPTQVLGTGVSISIPYPGTCVSRWISVKYKDASGRYRICCRLIYFCNPINCNTISMKYTPNLGYAFSIDQSLNSMSWILEETGTSLGTAQTSTYVPVGQNCDYRTVSLRYYTPGLGWQICCLRFYWCDPAACGDQITFGNAGDFLSLQAPDNLQSITWYKDDILLGNSNPQSTDLTLTGNHKIYVRFFDPCDNSWKWCCRSYTPGGTNSSLTFDFDNKVCGAQNQIVEVPLRVKGFTNLKNFQFSVNLEDSLKGRLLEIIPENITGELLTNIINPMTGQVAWESGSSVTVPDNTILAIARIRILTNVTGESKISISGSPVPIYAEDGSGNEIVPIIREGSFCFENLVTICGKIMREDNVPIPNVTVSLNGCKRFTTTTDSNGQYCFEDMAAGSGYEISASKDTNYKNGVNTGDLSAIKRHILGIVKLNTPYRILAGDGKKSNGINTGDISELRRLIQGVITDLPSCQSWEFTDKRFVFPNPENPFSVVWPSTLRIQNVQQDIHDADMIGWKMGDVNVSNNPISVTGDNAIENRSVTDLYLSLSSTQIPTADTFFIEVTTRQFNDVLNGSFSIQFDPEKFELAGIADQNPALSLSGDDFVINPSGSLVFVWGLSEGVTLPDSSVLFSMMFIPKVAEVELSEVTFSNDPTEIYFENEAAEILNVITSNGEINVPVREILPEQVTVSPNPAGDWVSVRIRLDAPSTIEVLLMNEMGVRVGRLSSEHESTTLFSGRLALGELPPGVYFMRVSTASGTITQKILHF